MDSPAAPTLTAAAGPRGQTGHVPTSGASGASGAGGRGRAVIADLLAQVAQARRGGTKLIRIPAGRHAVFPGDLPARACYVSNNDSGIRPVLFDLTDLNGVEIDGQGAALIFHGEVIPFMAERCRDLKIAGLSIDWDRPFMSQGVVREADHERLRLEMHPEHGFEVREGRPVFLGPGYESGHLHNMLAFDATRRETAFRAPDHYGVIRTMRAETDGKRRLDFYGAFESPSNVGDLMVIKHHGRTAPGLCFSRCHGVVVEDVTVHHAGGMAFVGQATRDITLRRCRVEPPRHSDRVFSSHADATHFTDCHGQIELIDCHFANQLDDATNIHGVYRRIAGSGTSDRLHARLVHPQQDGVETLAPGDTIALFDDRDFGEIGRAEVRAVANPDTRSAIYELDQAVRLRDGHTIAMRWDHDIHVHIRGCEARANRARGLLISTLGRVLIEDNRLHVPGSAIQFNFDGNSWYESGPVEDVTIRRNHFDNCLYGIWGPALFSVRPEIQAEHRGHTANRNIRITDNLIQTSDPRMLYAHSVAGLDFTGNRIQWNDAYPRDHDGPVYRLGESAVEVRTQPVEPPASPQPNPPSE
jgi:hypothetical protein